LSILVLSQTVLLAYFSQISEEKKPSTLWATSSILRTMIELKLKKDISKYAKLLMFLKRQNVGFKSKKSSVFSRQNIDDFLAEAPEEFLPIKVALIIAISGACRSDELLKMKVTDINILEEKIAIEIPDTKTYRSRSFIIIEPIWVKLVQKYIDLRKSIENQRLFLQWRHGKLCNQLPKVETFMGHAFRRTAATLLANNGANVLQLKRLGG
ncbi:hypothetical protein NQ315_013212, partial [Exocentrus adspersus]